MHAAVQKWEMGGHCTEREGREGKEGGYERPWYIAVFCIRETRWVSDRRADPLLSLDTETTRRHHQQTGDTISLETISHPSSHPVYAILWRMEGREPSKPLDKSRKGTEQSKKKETK